MGSYLTPADIDALNNSKLTRASPFAIQGVSHTQLSIARHYGGCRYNGESYTYIPETDELIREDVFRFIEKRRRRKPEPSSSTQPALFPKES